MSGDPEQEYFSDGISEDIITALSKLRWFFVIARNSSFMYKGKAVHVKQVGEDLGVGYVLEGSVRKNGGRVRITAQLNDVANGSHIWAERYDRDVADIFSRTGRNHRGHRRGDRATAICGREFSRPAQAAGNLDAWDLVMQALSYYWRVTRQDHAIAQELLEKAIAIDPNNGQALGVLAASYTFGAHMGWVELERDRTDCRTYGAGGDPGRQRGRLGALCAGRLLSDYAALRQFAGGIRTGAAPQSEFLASPELLCHRIGLLRPLGRRPSRRRAVRSG